ncbi:MAG: ABC transporter permease [Candidatus Sumerlaeaceae bacterium]|nr:ABC transporter permease [Candidatus Sumerlaeaceae bacterium]
MAEAEAVSHGAFHPLTLWRRIRRDLRALAGLAIVLVFVALAVFAPVLAPHDPARTDWARGNEPPFWVKGGAGRTASGTTWFGRDVAGRDILSRVIHGTRVSLMAGLLVVTIAGLIGVSLGALAGYFGGVVDTLVMRVVDILLAFPFLILAIAVVSIFPRTTLFHIALVLGLTTWPGICRLTRAQVLATREQEFVAAARALGASHGAVLRRHILPNCIGPVVIWFTMGIAGAIMSEASLSFLGFGGEDSLSWGTMIDNGLRKAYFPNEWWPVAFPAAALALLVLGFNMLGDGLQDALNPRLKR